MTIHVLRQALDYTGRGWPVFPCQPGKKTPATVHGHLDATTDPGQVYAWFGRDPELNLAIATGAPGIDVLDIDQRGEAGDGARTPPNRTSIVPCRSRSMSSTESAPAAIPATRHGIFRSAFTPRSPPGRTCSRDQAAEPGPVREGHDRDQPGVRHEIRVVERCVRLRLVMQQSQLTGVLSNRVLEASDTLIVPVQRAPFTLARPKLPLFGRWIEA